MEHRAMAILGSLVVERFEGRTLTTSSPSRALESSAVRSSSLSQGGYSALIEREPNRFGLGSGVELPLDASGPHRIPPLARSRGLGAVLGDR